MFMSTKRLLANFLLALILPLTAIPGQAAENDLCAHFKGGKVDQSVLETMLEAAALGQLYRMDASSSKVGFCVNSQFRRIEANFEEFEGGMTLSKDGAGNAQTLMAVNAASLDTDGALTESMIKSSSFFDVEKYPEILFVSTGFEWTSSTSGLLMGNLTLHGITKPVTFDVTLKEMNDTSTDAGARILLKATTRISRAQFGMDRLPSVVDDDVQLCMSVEASKFDGKS